MNLAADIMRQGLESPKIDDLGPGVLWGTTQGVHVGRQRGIPKKTQPWHDLKFSSKDTTLFINEWKIQCKGPRIAVWLASYLNAFVPGDKEYTVQFTEWGRLGITFAVYGDVVIPVVFTVDEPARSLGVKPASVLVSLNNTRIDDLPPDANMLDFISNADFPKTCVFKRPDLSLKL